MRLRSERIYKDASQCAEMWKFFDERGLRAMTLCTGVFDVLHVGHLELLSRAVRQPFGLVIGINSDASVRRIKGEGRPIVKQADRAWMLASLWVTEVVFVFDEETVVETLKTLRPAVWVKGGDRSLETLDPDERRTAEEIGTRIVILPRIGDYSTTGILEKSKA